MLRRGPGKTRGGAPFLGTRPPSRLAGYNPAPKGLERVPTPGEPPPAPYVPDEPVFPPEVTEWSPPYIPPFDLPDVVDGVPPGVPTEPPCDTETNPECPPPPPPPPPGDVPEPATWMVVIVGLAATFFLLGPRRREPIE